jgi:formate dehydrogenase maturation protein FdhE
LNDLSASKDLLDKIEQAKTQLIELQLQQIGLDFETAKRVNETVTALRQESNKMTEAFRALFQPLLDKKPEDLTDTDKKVLAVISTSAETTLAETARGFALGSDSTAAKILLSAALDVDRNLHLMSANPQPEESESVEHLTNNAASKPPKNYIG